MLLLALTYVAGAFMVTVLGNVPPNRALALVDPRSAEAGKAVAEYLRDRTLLNHLRTGASLAASALAAWSLVAAKA